MQAVGYFAINPTGGTGPGKGRQLNNSGKDQSFEGLMSSLVGQALSDGDSSSKFTPLEEDKFSELGLGEIKYFGGFGSQIIEEPSGADEKGQNIQADLLLALQELERIISGLNSLAYLPANIGEGATSADSADSRFFQSQAQTGTYDELLVKLNDLVSTLKGVLEGNLANKGNHRLQQTGYGSLEEAKEVLRGLVEKIQLLKMEHRNPGQSQREPVYRQGIEFIQNNLESENTGTINQATRQVSYVGVQSGKALEELNTVARNCLEALGKLTENLQGKSNDQGLKGLDTVVYSTVTTDKAESTVITTPNYFSPNSVSVSQQNERAALFHSLLGRVAEKAKLVKTPEQSEFLIQLKPEYLGKLQMRIIFENGIVTAKFGAQTPQVKELLESNMNNLRQSLSEQGLKVDQLEVNLGFEKDYSMFNREFFQGKGKGSRKGTSQQVGLLSVKEREMESDKFRWSGDSTVDYVV